MSGFANTGVQEDEGQHLQTIYLPANAFGGPGCFGFNEASFMDETHPLATPENAELLFNQWRIFWDLSKDCLLEKSPPNIVRTRFLQKLWPDSRFVIILRHPISVAYATKRWSNADTLTLVDHTLCCYKRFICDMPFLHQVYVLRYEEFVLEPQRYVNSLLEWMGLEPFDFRTEVRSDVNDKYFAMWKREKLNLVKRCVGSFRGLSSRLRQFEKEANRYGYSMYEPESLRTISWPHGEKHLAV